MILLGSISKHELAKLIRKPISEEKRLGEVERLHREAKFKSFDDAMRSAAAFKHTARRVTLTMPPEHLDELKLEDEESSAITQQQVAPPEV